MTNQTIDALGRLRLQGMIDALEQQSRSSEFLTLGVDERLSHLVTAEMTYRDERRMERLLRACRQRA